MAWTAHLVRYTTQPFLCTFSVYPLTAVAPRTGHHEYHRTSTGYALSLLRAAPTLTVRRVDIVDDLDVSQLPLQHVPGALRLRIGRGCLGLCRLFAYPQYASLTNGLTHLAINAPNPLTQSNMHIISNASRTLNSLRIQMARATCSCVLILCHHNLNL